MKPTRDMAELLKIMARLRDPNGGCPWDIQQDFASVVPCTIEEAYEVADAIKRQDYQELKLELGDLLLQVVFHAQMAKEQSLFEFSDVVEGLSEKLIRRHPHVFAGTEFASEDEVNANWEAEKIREREKNGKEQQSILDAVTLALPAMTRAVKLQKKAAKVGFDWNSVDSVLDKIEEELVEVREELAKPVRDQNALEDEVGDLLFAVTNLARHLRLEPETALRKCNYKFESRFQFIERELKEKNRQFAETNLDELENLWQKAKISGL